MSLTRSIALNTGSQAIGKVISTVIGVFIVALMTRYLGKEGFGYYSTANNYFQIIAILIDLGITITIVQLLGQHKGDEKYERRAVSATITLRILIGVVVFTLAPLLALLLPYAWQVKAALFAILLSFYAAFINQIVISVQQRHLKMHIVAVSEVFGRAILLIGIIVCAWLNLGLIPVILFVSLGSLINLIINLSAAVKYADFRWNWDPSFWKILLTTSWPIGLSMLFHLAYFKADTFILSLVRPASDVGIYSAAYRVLEILITFPFMLAGIMLPLMANAHTKNNLEDLGKYIRQSYTAILLFALPLLVGGLLLGNQIITFVSGNDFTASGPILQILVIATAFIYLGTIGSHVVVAINAQKRMLPVYVTIGTLTVILYAILIPIYGYWAAAWLTVASEFFMAVITSWIAFRSAPNSFAVSPALKILLASLIMGLVVYYLRDFWLPIPLLVGAAVYALVALGSGAISKNTLREIFPAK